MTTYKDINLDLANEWLPYSGVPLHANLKFDPNMYSPIISNLIGDAYGKYISNWSVRDAKGFETFIRTYPSVIYKIHLKQNSQREDRRELFSQPIIKLVYYLVFSKRIMAKKLWPLSGDLLELVYMDLGMSYNNY